MKIIQSCFFIGDNYNRIDNSKNYLMNFYTMLMSYIMLKKHHGSVTMYCNPKAFNEVVKYVPYDEIIVDVDIEKTIKINEFKNSWHKTKLGVYLLQDEPFIHLDTDVILYEDLLNNLINSGFDVLQQSLELTTNKHNIQVYNTVKHVIETSRFKDLFNEFYVKYGYETYNCGVCGFTDIEYVKEYVNGSNELFNLFDNEKSEIHPSFYEQSYLTAICRRDGKNVIPVVPTELSRKYSEFTAMDKIGYKHYWGDSKFNSILLYLIRNMIRIKHDDYFKHIVEFEKTLKNVDLSINKDTDFGIYVDYGKI